MQKLKANFTSCIYSQFKVQLAWAGPLFTESNAMGRPGTVTLNFPAFGPVLASHKSGLLKAGENRDMRTQQRSAARQSCHCLGYGLAQQASAERGGKEGVMG